MNFSVFFVMQKDYHERFFGFFAFFTWGLQCLRLLDDFGGVGGSGATDYCYFGMEILEKMRSGFFFAKKVCTLFYENRLIHKNFMDFIKILWNS